MGWWIGGLFLIAVVAVAIHDPLPQKHPTITSISPANRAMNDASPELKLANIAAREGADITSRYFQDLSTADVQNKSSDDEYDGIVTRADVESERAIVSRIRNQFPNHAILGEEEHAGPVDAEHLWIIDPLDGTNNFAHQIPHFAVSVAYYRSGQPHCGVVLNPSTNDCFITQRDRGAWWNDQPVQVNQHAALDATMIGVGFYYDRGAMMRATLKAIDALFEKKIHGIRRMGTAALDIVQVGLGRFGGFFEYQLSPWDFAAARLFLEEAGGTITTCQGEPLPLKKTSVLATNGRLHQPMLEIVGRFADH